MTLFGFRKKEERNGAGAVPETKMDQSCSLKAGGEIGCIKVLGSGCASCHALYENAKAAVKEMQLLVEVEYITDLQTVMEYGVMSMPALVVNDKVVSTGKVLKTKEIQALLQQD